MFGLKSRQRSQPQTDSTQIEPTQIDPMAKQAIEEAERILFPQSQVLAHLVEPERQRSYEEIAKQLGFMPAELIRAQLLQFFAKKSIKIYDNDQVSAWLTRKKVEAKVEHWCWRPLREKDIVTDYRWGYDAKRQVWEDGFYCSTSWKCRPYARLVPQHTLETVAEIEAQFGNRVNFFVSDYARPDADPFIMVRPAPINDGEGDEYHFVFDAWDEPGFGV